MAQEKVILTGNRLPREFLMGAFQNYPYADVHQLNLDWIIKEVKDVKERTDEIDQAVTDSKAYAETAQESAENASESQARVAEDKESIERSIQDWNDQSADLNSRVSLNTTNIAVQTERIDTIISGVTPDADAELLDIRVGATGVSYSTAGGAVRQQIIDVTGKTMDIIPFSWSRGGISTTTGNEVSNNTRMRTGFIEINAGDVYEVSTNENLLLIAFYDLDKTFIEASNSAQYSDRVESSYTGYARIVMRKDTSDSTINVSDFDTISAKLAPNVEYKSKTDVIRDDLNDIANWSDWAFTTETSGKYVRWNGNEASATTFNISKPIVLQKGDSIKFTATGDSTNVAMIAEITGSNTYSLLVRSIDSSEHTYSYVATHSMSVALSYNNTKSKSCRIFRPNYMPKEFLTQTPEFLSLFKNCACIGDSLTRGFQSEYPAGQRNRDGGYPTRLSRMTKLNVYNFGLSGATTSSWLANSTMSSYDYSIFDLALICLGRNGDLASSTTEQNDYTSIINKLKLANPNMTIFCLSLPPATNMDNTLINSTIQSIASANNVFYLDIETNSEVSNAMYRNDNVHFYALGYDLLADSIKKRLNEFINDHQNDFMQIYTDKTYPDVIAGLVE